ncbi:hypothetical protein Adt_03688 [Abeliophyllum distichum]|uniref:Uncharacterized protein n=1 Tax=Abeliophyllum distichum TaxID=126358 RepID=A0ABD1VZM1_9LAMI
MDNHNVNVSSHSRGFSNKSKPPKFNAIIACSCLFTTNEKTCCSMPNHSATCEIYYLCFRSKLLPPGSVASAFKPFPFGTRLFRSKLLPPRSMASTSKPFLFRTKLFRKKLLPPGSIACTSKPLPLGTRLFHNNLPFHSKLRTLRD